MWVWKSRRRKRHDPFDDKKYGERHHGVYRAAQRYGIILNGALRREIIRNICTCTNASLLEKYTNRVSKYKVLVPRTDIWAIILFDFKRQEIITFLPPRAEFEHQKPA